MSLALVELTLLLTHLLELSKTLLSQSRFSLQWVLNMNFFPTTSWKVPV